jgi:hypothetical protein
MSTIIALPPPTHLTVAARVRGRAALAAAALVLAVSRSRPTRLRTILGVCAAGTKPATYPQADRADAVVTTLSPRCGSGRNCLPRTIAVALYCRMAGTWPTWRAGVRYPPLESHAWIEVDGRSVGEPGQIIGTYTPTITVARNGATT